MAKNDPLMFSFQEETVQEARDQLQLQGDQLKALAMAERMRVDFVYNGAALGRKCPRRRIHAPRHGNCRGRDTGWRYGVTRPYVLSNG